MAVARFGRPGAQRDAGSGRAVSGLPAKVGASARRRARAALHRRRLSRERARSWRRGTGARRKASGGGGSGCGAIGSGSAMKSRSPAPSGTANRATAGDSPIGDRPGSDSLLRAQNHGRCASVRGRSERRVYGAMVTWPDAKRRAVETLLDTRRQALAFQHGVADLGKSIVTLARQAPLAHHR